MFGCFWKDSVTRMRRVFDFGGESEWKDSANFAAQLYNPAKAALLCRRHEVKGPMREF
jgi:hypothetical protein